MNGYSQDLRDRAITLYQTGNYSKKDLAELLFNSIKTLKELNDEVVVLPGHGAGSACGTRPSAPPPPHR